MRRRGTRDGISRFCRPPSRTSARPQYVFVGTLPSGAALRIPACLIVTVRDGLVVRAQEYVDSAHAAALAEVFQPTG